MVIVHQEDYKMKLFFNKMQRFFLFDEDSVAFLEEQPEENSNHDFKRVGCLVW